MTSSVNWDKELQETTEDQETKAQHRELLIAERCEKCGPSSQAFVRAVKVMDNKEYELLFCNHHYKEFAPTLLIQGFLIDDQSWRINAKPTEDDSGNV